MQKYYIDEDDFIGGGGFGNVFGVKDNFHLAAKRSNNSTWCGLIEKEYNTASIISEHLNNDHDYNSLVLASLLSPLEFQHQAKGEGQCFTVMNRIFPPIIGECPDPKNYFYGRPGSTVQALFGYSDKDAASLGISERGSPAGRETIMKYWKSCPQQKDYSLEQGYYELGKLLALIHFVARYDGYDLEVYLGREWGDERLKFFIADFDRFDPVTDFYDKSILDRMSWSMGAFEYFPSASDDSYLNNFYIKFREGYLEIAEREGLSDVGEEILSNV